jgi:hypothetical protein
MRPRDLFPRQGSLAPVAGFPAALTEAFAAFWAAYPLRRPNPRAAAAVVFARVLRQGNLRPEQLVAAARAYAAEVQERGIAEAYIPHARTWLHRGYYLDYLAPADTTAPGPVPAPPEPVHYLWPAMRQHMDAATFRAWLGKCTVADVNGGWRLIAPSAFVAARIRGEYLAPLHQAFPGHAIIISVRAVDHE